MEFFKQFDAQIKFRQEWFDKRLSYHDDYLHEFEFIYLATDQHIWKPDTFFQNEKVGHYHLIDASNRFTKIRSDGYIIDNVR